MDKEWNLLMPPDDGRAFDIDYQKMKQRAEAAEGLLRDMVAPFRLAEDGNVEMLALGDWGHINPEAAEIVKQVRAHLKLEGGS